VERSQDIQRAGELDNLAIGVTHVDVVRGIDRHTSRRPQCSACSRLIQKLTIRRQLHQTIVVIVSYVDQPVAVDSHIKRRLKSMGSWARVRLSIEQAEATTSRVDFHYTIVESVSNQLIALTVDINSVWSVQYNHHRGK
jgi:hypothetical protein